MRTSKPGAGNKNFIRTASGGWNTCITGNPKDKDCDVLANCVGFASGRFNEIINNARGTSGCTYKYLNCNAENFIERAISAGLKIGSTPRVGAIGCAMKGSTLNGSDGAGHVWIVEKVNSDGSTYTSESGYGSSAFWNQTRSNKNGRWGLGSGYSFRGFIYLPDDVQKVVDEAIKPAPTPTPTPTPATRKFNKGDKVVFTGRLYADSYGGGAGQTRTNLQATITLVNTDSKATKPYNINNGLGWVAEADLTAAGSSKSHFEPGDTVTVNGVGRATSNGTGAYTRNYSNAKAKVIYYKEGKSHPYALNLNNNMNGVTGWFTSSSVK
jgi:surface antigen